MGMMGMGGCGGMGGFGGMGNGMTVNTPWGPCALIPVGGGQMPQTSQMNMGGGGGCSGPVTKEGDWLCEMCGNHNFASRDVCNTRKCQAPRPEKSSESTQPPMPVPVATPLNMFPSDQVNGDSNVVDAKGDWVCMLCGNHNYGSRDFCNTNRCKAPRPDMTPRPPKMSAAAQAAAQ